MNIIIKSVLLVLFVSLFMMPSCDKNTVSYNLEEELDLTQRENEEAELAALWLSNKIVAPQELYEKVLYGFSLLRSDYSLTIPEVNIPFTFPDLATGVWLNMSDTAVELIRSGNYDAWDYLNTFYGIADMDTFVFIDNFIVTLSYNGRLNTYKLSQKYAVLPGVVRAERAGAVCGDWSNTYPWLDNGNLTFLVRNAWGDCPAGCTESHLYYFKMRSGEIDYIGDWDTGPAPSWWDEAKVAYETYRCYPNDPE